MAPRPDKADPEMPRAHRIVFTPSGLTVDAAEGSTVLSVAQRSQIDLDSVCGGRGVCGRCQFRPSYGAFPKWAITSEPANLSDVGGEEVAYQERRPMLEGARLGCQATVLGPLVVDIPAESQAHAPVIRKDVNLKGLSLDSVSAFRVVSVTSLDVDSGTLTNAVTGSLEHEWGIRSERYSPTALRNIAALSESGLQGPQTLTLQIRWSEEGDTVCGVRLGAHVDQIGVAIDLGSTTIAAHLLDVVRGEVLASGGAMNPQIRLGEDLMSRVSYVMMNPEGADQLTLLVRDAVSGLIQGLLEESGARAEDVTDVVVVGNPVMHHSFLGFDVVPLGQMPFELATDGPVIRDAEDLGLPLPNGTVYLPPCIAGHVGADTAAAIVAEAPYQKTNYQLLVDVGTNAEIVFGDQETLYAASSPTGPAFEGAQITHGQRAIPGAIERVRINRETFEPQIKVVGCDYWSSDPEFATAIQDVGVTGICGSGIIEAIAELFLSGLMTTEGVILDKRSATGRIIPEGRTFAYVLHDVNPGGNQHSPRVLITQPDVRAVQLAKAALRAGVDLLIERAGGVSPEEIRLAGAFGAHIDPKYAMVLGLIPDCSLESVIPVGNSAGTGAIRLLLSRHERKSIQAVVPKVIKVETAIEARFQELFVDAMSFPHATADTPNLRKAVNLPPLPLPSTGTSSRRRRRPGRKES